MNHHKLWIALTSLIVGWHVASGQPATLASESDGAPQDKRRANCSITISDDFGHETLPFVLPSSVGLSEPVVVLSALGLDVEIRYGIGMASEFSNDQHQLSEDVPVHYLAVDPFGIGSKNVDKPESLYVLDRAVVDFNFDFSRTHPYRYFAVTCAAEPGYVDVVDGESTASVTQVSKVGCQFGRLDENDDVIASVESNILSGDQAFLVRDVRDLFYGWALGRQGGSVSTEIANTPYYYCAMASAGHPNGVRFLRHISDIPAHESKGFPALRLSAQCQVFDGPLPVEVRVGATEYATFNGSYTKTFNTERIDGRQAFRVQFDIFHDPEVPGEKAAIAIVLPSGRVLEPTAFTYDDDQVKYVATFDGTEAELIGPIQLQVQTCAPNNGGECVPTGVESEVTFQGPTLSYR